MSIAKSLLLAALAGVMFVLSLEWMLGALGWAEAGLAQAIGRTGGNVGYMYRYLVPLADSGVCGLLVGLAFGLIEARWKHVAAFFAAFYLAEMTITGATFFAQLFFVAPFMWMFPIFACMVILLSQRLKRGAVLRA